MTTTMPAMKRTIDRLARAGMRGRVKVMIGRAREPAYADEIGADGYARDSTLAVVKAKELLGVREAVAGEARGGRSSSASGGRGPGVRRRYGTELFAAGWPTAPARSSGTTPTPTRPAIHKATSTREPIVETNTFGAPA